MAIRLPGNMLGISVMPIFCRCICVYDSSILLLMKTINAISFQIPRCHIVPSLDRVLVEVPINSAIPK